MKFLRKFKGLSKVKKVLVSIVVLPIMLFVLVFAGIIVSIAMDDSTPTENISEDKSEYSVQFGELLDVTTTEDVMVIKTKIEPNLTDKMTIQQNAHNVEKFILDNDLDNINELQYWAVADMTNGSESKVISFTLDKYMIDAVKNKSLFGANIIDNAKDVWIHPSLEN